MGGSARTYTANFFDEQGLPISSVAVWEISSDGVTGTPTWTTIEDKTSTTIRMRVQNDIRLIGRSIDLRLTDSGGMAQTILRIPIVSLT